MTERRVRINGKIFLYKQKAPFVSSGASIKGAIEYDPDEDKIRCHECGGWFQNLGPHLKYCPKAQGMSGREYKYRHGLKLTSSLVSERLRDIHRRDALARHLRPTVRPHARPWEHRRSFSETRNERGTCQAQLLQRMKDLGARLGRTFTMAEMTAAGISTRSTFHLFGVKDLRSLMALVGLVPNGQGFRVPGKSRKPHPRLYAPDLLAEVMVNFYVRHGRVPSWTDYRRGLLPDRRTFIRAFGSIPAAFEAAGLGLVARKAS